MATTRLRHESFRDLMRDQTPCSRLLQFAGHTSKSDAPMKPSTPILVAFAAFLLSGCATSYQSNGFTGGYSETQLAPDVFRVAFRGNRYTSPEQARDFCMLRAAELALQHGFTHLARSEEHTSELQSLR